MPLLIQMVDLTANCLTMNIKITVMKFSSKKKELLLGRLQT